jgi:hypothetical protein
MTDHQFATDFATEAAKGTPPVLVAGSAMMGAVDWQTWVFILTAIYLLMQIIWLGWKFVQKARGEKADG